MQADPTPSEKRIIKEKIKNNNIVFDVGANIGEWSQFTINNFPNVIIHAFEPIPEIYKLLEKNMAKYKNIILNNVALFNDNKSTKFYYYVNISKMSSIFRRRHEVEINIIKSKPKIINVPTILLDDYCKYKNINKIDYLKIDTEGAEFPILIGSKNMISTRKIKKIQFEYGECFLDGGTKLENVFKLLLNNGYKIFRITKTDLIPIPEFTFKLEDYVYTNFLAEAM